MGKSIQSLERHDTIAIKQTDANTFTATQKHSGTKYKTTVHSVISKDGKTMTNTVSATNADGIPIRYTMVYEKQ